MRKDIFWNSIGTTAWSFLSLILLIIVTRINGIEDSGLFSFAFAFALIMFTVACYGGRAYQVSDHKNSFSSDIYVSLRLITSLATILLAVAFILLNGYDWQKAALVLILVAHRIFDAISEVFYGVLQKKQHLHIVGKSLFYKSSLSIIVFVIIDLLTENLYLSSLALPIISLLFVIFYDIPRSKKFESFSIKLGSAKIKTILHSTFLPFLITLMALLFANIPRYFIDLSHPDLQGYFGIIIMPLSLVILLFSFISTPLLVSLSNKYNNVEYGSLRKTVQRIVYITTAISVGLCTLVIFAGAPLLSFLFGVDFSQYIIYILLVVIIGYALSITSLFTNIAIIARRLRVPAALYLASCLLLITLCLFLVPTYDIRGAIISYIIASFAQLAAMWVYYLHITHDYKSSINS